MRYGSFKTSNKFLFHHFFPKLAIDVFVAELLLKHGSTTTMQQNLEILDVLMFTTSSSSTTTIWEEAHAFTNPSPLGPCKKFKKPKWKLNRVFINVGLPNCLWEKTIVNLNGKLLMVICKI
jgi:hypothetical protein